MAQRFLASFFALLTLLFCIALDANAAKKNVVFWLSIDGFRGEYLQKTQTPHFDQMIAKSFHTNKLTPIFPSITFPSHASQATGVQVAEHGIVSNAFYDSDIGTVFNYPGDSKLLQAEPIWQTVKRGGLKSAVMDWPLSYKQTGPLKADYFHDEYVGSLSDEERLNIALNEWQKGPSTTESYDLVMAYIVGTDSAGHSYGPNDARVLQVVEKVDALMGHLQKRLKEIAKKKYNDEADIYLLVTTDHGMIDVTHAVNIRLFTPLDQSSAVRTVTGGNVGHMFLDKIPQSERAGIVAKTKAELKKYPFVQVFERSELPKRWDFAHLKRVGDVVLVLDSGYIFSGAAKKPVVTIAEIGSPLGMHGYDPKSEKDMKGFLMLYRWPEFPRGSQIRKTPHALQLHPTVAKLLKVAPSAQAKHPPIEVLKQLH